MAVPDLVLGLRAAARHVLDASAGRVRVAFPDGHFYSPIPDLRDVQRRRAQIFERKNVLPGIELRGFEQCRLVEELARYGADAPFTSGPSPDCRYHYDNNFFSYGDGQMLYAILRQRRPQLVVEVGSGYSSALLLDVADRWLPDVRLVFIEPYPDRLRGLLKPSDLGRAEILETAVQSVDLDVFDQLAAGDILLIDSTHVAKAGSDVPTLFFDVLPRLKPGVLVHVHDIFYPFEYPEAWVMEGRAWNEAYLLRAFLLGNPTYRIVLWNSYLAEFHREVVSRSFPLWARNTGGSLWIERTDAAMPTA